MLFYSIWKPDRIYKITYELNSGSGGPSAPQTGEQLDGEITLDSNRPTKSNLYFTGWCNKPTDNALCPGKVYWPGEPYPLADGRIVTMYALYAPQELKDLGSLGVMQDFDCDSKVPNINNYGTIQDSRDDNTYSVARLKDGRCWMTQDLKIQNFKLSPLDSDVTEEYTLPVNQTSINACSTPNRELLYMTGARGYYSWLTATAGKGIQTTNDPEPIIKSSICPRGWHLPTLKSLQDITSIFNTTTAQQAPQNFISGSGWIENGRIVPSFNDSVWWSNQGSGYGSMQGSYLAYYLDISPHSHTNYFTYMGNCSNLGANVRCISY